MGLWAGIKYALNSTLGTDTFRPLDRVNIGGVEIENETIEGTSWIGSSANSYGPDGIVSIDDGTGASGLYLLGSFTTSSTDQMTSAWKRDDDGNGTFLASAPDKIYYSGCVELNGKIHVIGGTNSYSTQTQHKIYDPKTNTWTLTYNIGFTSGTGGYGNTAVVLNGEIHVFGDGGTSSTQHYKYDGISWTRDTDLPFEFYQSCACVHDGEIHVFGGRYTSSNHRKHYKLTSAGWVAEAQLPLSSPVCGAISCRGELHIFYNTNAYCQHYKLVENTWVLVEEIYGYASGSFSAMKLCVHNGAIYMTNVRTKTSASSGYRDIVAITDGFFNKFMDKDNIVTSDHPLSFVGDNAEQIDSHTIRCTKRGKVLLKPTGKTSKLLIR